MMLSVEAPLPSPGDHGVEMQLLHGIPDDERPHGDLRAHVEELRDDTPDVIPVPDQAAEGRPELQGLVLLAQVGHPRQPDRQQQHDHHGPDGHIGHRHGIQLVGLDGGQLRGRAGPPARRP